MSMERLWRAANVHMQVHFGIADFEGLRAIDFGSGTGKPMMHFMGKFPKAKSGLGIEFNEVRVALAMAVLKRIFRRLGNTPGLNTVCGDVFELNTLLDFIDVLFMFDCAFEPELMDHIGKIWNASSAKMLICFRKPEYLEKHGYLHLRLVATVKMFLTGSMEGRTAFLFIRATPTSKKRPPQLLAPAGNGPLYQRLVDAAALCEDVHAPHFPDALLAYADKTHEEGLRTTEAVTMANGKVQMCHIRQRKPQTRYEPHSSMTGSANKRTKA